MCEILTDWRIPVLVAVLSSHAILAGAQAPAAGMIPSKLKLETGKQIYESGCVACHGPDGKGQPKSVIGFEPRTVIPRFINALPTRFEVGEGTVVFNAVQVDIDPATGRALAIERIQRLVEA
jgi:hypothetical protein